MSKEVAAAKAKVAKLQIAVAEKERLLQESERANVEVALQAEKRIAPYLRRLEELADILKEEDKAQAALDEALSDERLIISSGEEELADLRAQIAETEKRVSSIERDNLALAKAFEDEVLSLVSRIAIFEKRKEELTSKLASFSPPS